MGKSIKEKQVNIKKYLKLSDDKLIDLEKSYNYLPKDYEIEDIGFSIDKLCLKETLKIAKEHSQCRQTIKREQKLKEQRKLAILSKFIKLK